MAAQVEDNGKIVAAQVEDDWKIVAAQIDSVGDDTLEYVGELVQQGLVPGQTSCELCL